MTQSMRRRCRALAWMAVLGWLPVAVLAWGERPSSAQPAPSRPAAPTSPEPSPSPAVELSPPWVRIGPMGWRGADQRFIVMMIPHHQGAIAMARLAIERARHPEIRTLAEQIISTQTREISLMRLWYRQWYGTAVPSWTTIQAGPGMGMGGMGGRSSAASLDALRQAPDFDRAFLEQMVAHHRMGVMMAAHAQWHGKRRQLQDLEVAMVQAQSREIAQMERWYRRWYGSPLP